MKDRKEMTAERALARLQDMCARAEHSTRELADKLRTWGIGNADAAKIIERLRKERYVDDRRFAEAYTNDKIRFARWGKRKVQQGLYAKGITRDDIAEALAAVDDKLYEGNLTDIIRLKIKNAPQLAESYEGRTKLFRHLVSKGYEPDLAARLLKAELARLADGAGE